MLWLISFFNYADRQAIFSVFPLLEREMGLTPVQLGLLGSSFAWVYGLGAPFAGMVVDRDPAADRHPRRAAGVESHLRRDDDLANVPAPVLLARRRGTRRDLLLPGVDVAHQRLSRSRHPFESDGAAPDERVHRHDRRRLLCRPDRPVLRLAALVRRLRRTRHPARSGTAALPHRAGARRGGCHGSNRGACAGSDPRSPFAAGVSAAAGTNADAALPDGRIHVRELRRGRSAVVDAQVPLRQVPHGPGDGRADRDDLRPAREHGRRTRRRLAR